jgi:hypothetical protein
MRKRFLKPKNFIIPLVLWAIPVIYIIVVSPDNIFAVAFFYGLIALPVFFSLRLILARNSGLRWTLAVILFLILRQLQVGNMVNILLLLMTFTTIELYYRKK